MDKEVEQKDVKLEFLENKIGLPDCKVFSEMNKLELNRPSSKRKGDRNLHRINVPPNYHKNSKNK